MWRLLFLIAAVSAQIPSLGWCPDYLPMADFNINRYLGTWYEAERYFTVSELGSRCVTTKYEATPEGRILVSNEITNSFSGMKRVMDGYLQMTGREGEGRMIVKYASLPVPYETEYSVLDTDYDSYAVMWSCSGIGPVHTQNAWVLTRERLANSATLQKAYAALEKYKVSRAFFVKTNQETCNILPEPAALPEYKDAGDVAVSGKHASLVPAAADVGKIEQNIEVEKRASSDVKPMEMPKEKAPVEMTKEEVKPKPVSEMMVSESKKEEEKAEQPAEVKKDVPEVKQPSAVKEMGAVEKKVQ